MFRKIILIGLCLLAFESYAQDSKLNIELCYPLSIDKNFVGENYNGIIDLGLRYRFLELNVVNIGGSFNIGYLKNSKDARNQPFDVNLYTLQPRFFAELNLPSIPKFRPSFGLGYSLFLFNVSNNQPIFDSNISSNIENQNKSGINMNSGLAYDITEKIIIQVQYDFVKIGIDDNVPNITYNTNINIIKIGLGYRF